MSTKATLINLINSKIRNKAPKIIPSEHADVEAALVEAIFIPFEVKELDCTQQFITDNFNPTGLGINIMDGFAICNGQNGTKDRRKRTSVGYDPTTYVNGFNYSQIGNTFGEENHKITKDELPKIKLSFPIGDDQTGGGAYSTCGNNGSQSGYTEFMGNDIAHNNIQPSIVTLFVQRI